MGIRQRLFLLFLCLLILDSEGLFGQKGILLHFYESDTSHSFIVQIKVKDSLDGENTIRSFHASKTKSGYWGFSIDTIIRASRNWKIIYYAGSRIRHFKYRNGNISPFLFTKLIQLYGQEKPEVFALASTRYLSNIGYPFSEIRFDSIVQLGNQLSSNVNVLHHQIIYISKIIQENESLKIPPSFLNSIINIKPYQYFDLSKINSIPERIKNLEYFELLEQPHFIIEDSFCALKLSLKEVKKNRFNGIIGILPNSETSGELQLTGDVQLSLQNLFTRGIGFNLNWQKLQPYSQRLNLQFDYPYLFHQPIHLNTNFKLLKQDTSFLSIDWKIGLGFVKSVRTSIEVSLQSTTSNLIKLDTSFVFTKALPTKLDFQNLYGGVLFGYKNLDQLTIPKKGLKLDFQILAGYKKISKNEEVVKRVDAEGKSLDYLYRDITTPTFNAQIAFRLDYYHLFARSLCLKSSLVSKVLISQNILKNENFRIGGNKLMRGFDEENIYTPYFSVISEELRWFISNRSYMYSFLDVSMVQDNRFKSLKQDFPIGLGLGIALNTKGGIFAVSYALGKQLDNSFDFKTAKIHFGYINEF